MTFLISTLILLATGGIGPDYKPGETLTANEVIEAMKSHLTCSWSAETVDTFKSGDPDHKVTGVVCTFTATIDVLNDAVKRGCNLIITHEPTYYNHLDTKELLENDPVYEAKQAIIDKHNLIIFRFHDHWHRTTPDGIYVGMIDKFRTPYLSQCKLADILKIIFNSVPGNSVSVWFNKSASSAAA